MLSVVSCWLCDLLCVAVHCLLLCVDCCSFLSYVKGCSLCDAWCVLVVVCRVSFRACWRLLIVIIVVARCSLCVVGCCN